jgi:hypothetical protein
MTLSVCTTQNLALIRDFRKELGVANAKSLEDVYKSYLAQVVIVLNCFLCLPFPIQDLVFQQTSILPEETWQEHL